MPRGHHPRSAGFRLMQLPQPLHRLHPQPSYTINWGAHQLVTHTHTPKSSLHSIHFLELGFVDAKNRRSASCVTPHEVLGSLLSSGAGSKIASRRC
jgi:hypothetical protein